MEFVIYESMSGQWIAMARGVALVDRTNNITEATSACLNYVVNNVEYPYPTIKIVILGIDDD